MSGRADRPREQRPPRTLAQKLGSIVLGSEAIVVVLAGLTVFGLRALPPGIAPWWAIVGGLVLALAFLFVAGSITKPWAVAAGWTLQVVLALGALLEPAILVVALIFGGMWGYATIGGARLDRQRPTGSPAETHTESE